MQVKKLFFIIFLIFSTNHLFANEYPAVFQTKTALNIRKQPFQTGTKVGLLQKNTEVIVDSLHNDQWACIKYKGKVAYISTKYISYKSHVESSETNSFFSSFKTSFIPNIIPLQGTKAIVLNCFLVFLLIRFITCFTLQSLFFYAMIGIAWFVGYYIIGIFINESIASIIAIFLVVGFYLTVCLLNKKISLFLDLLCGPFYALNQLQYHLQKPWRFLEKNRTNPFCWLLRMSPDIKPDHHPMQRFCYRLWKLWHNIFSAILCILQIVSYLISTPLRLINAIIYNIFIHIPCALHDYIAEVFYPKGDGMRHLDKWEYLSRYFIKLPYRFRKFLLKRGFLTILESFLYTIIDIVVPTLTMYHGTSNSASYQITGDEDVSFIVGGGNYAGNGIYFAISKNTARHYARDAIIVSRVSLGRVLNVNIAPTVIRNLIAKNGHELTIWGLSQKINTIEWWRTKGEWWEYCMLQPSGVYKESWRIRPLYIDNLQTGFKGRVYKGMTHWLFKERK